MSEAKKYLLIDANNTQTISKILSTNMNHNSQRLTTPYKREVTNLDTTMSEIAQDQTLSPDEKVDKYEKYLNEYLNLRSLAGRPTAAVNSVQPKEIKQDKTKAQFTIDSFLLPIPKTLKTKARSLYSYLEQLPLDVLSSGQISINGKQIADSNISDLLNVAVNTRAVDKQVAGWDQFQKFLLDNNVPKSLLAKNVSNTIKKKDTRATTQSGFFTPTVQYNTPRKSDKRKGKLVTPNFTSIPSPLTWDEV